MTEPVTDEAEARRGAFSSRRVFILAAIGSAVGLGNIWRFPYIAYENGGGAFAIPYLIALLTAGLPFLFLDYAIGHRFRGSAPLSFRRLGRKAEMLGWWQVLLCTIIGVYYAAVIAWALRYAFFSVDKSWGRDPEKFFFGAFLQKAEEPGVGFDFVSGVLIPLVIVWAVILLIMALGVQKGVGASSVIFIPLLIALFLVLVVRSLFLPGASEGLDALFAPNWSALGDAAVWLAAYGQIFFSLSIGFGVMITYASYVKRRTDMTGSGAVVGLTNSSFELLAGIGVFSALGFIAQATNQGVDQVAGDGIGLAFVGFPTIISEAPGGSLIGVLFFASLVFAGITSLVSVLEVIISAFRDKLGLGRIIATLLVVTPMAIVSVLLFGTTTGLPLLDVVDHFVNRFGILVVAIVMVVVVAWGLRALPMLQQHLNSTGSLQLGTWWRVLVGLVVPIVLAVMLIIDLVDNIDEPYGGYPGWLIGIFGWGLMGLAVLLAIVLTALPWKSDPQLPEEKS